MIKNSIGTLMAVIVLVIAGSCQSVHHANETTTTTDSAVEGDSVRVATGQLFFVVTDLAIPGLFPQVTVNRSYTSGETGKGSLGQGWAFSYDARIIIGIQPGSRKLDIVLREHLAEIEQAYEDAYASHLAAVLAGEDAVGNADKAIEAAVRAKEASESAMGHARDGIAYAAGKEADADRAREAAENAWSAADRVLRNAAVIEGWLERRSGFLRRILTRAQSALSYVNDAVQAGEYAKRQAKIAGDQGLIDQAAEAWSLAVAWRTTTLEIIAWIGRSNGRMEGVRAALDGETGQKSRAEGYKTRADTNKGLADEMKSKATNMRLRFEEALRRAEEARARAEDAYQTAIALKANADQAKADAEASMDDVVAIEGMAARVRAMSEEATRKREYSESAAPRNRYVIDRGAHPGREGIGVGGILHIDGKGTPHRYVLDRAPNFDSDIRFPDGGRNYYPQGSTASSSLPNDDRLEVLPDGSYRLAKKRGHEYLFTYHGKLQEIREPNGRYLRFSYSEDMVLETVTDVYGRVVSFESRDGIITRVTDPAGRSCTYDYDEGGRLTSVTDVQGDTIHYGYSENLLTQIIKPDGGSREYHYIEQDDRWVVDHTVDEEGNKAYFIYHPEEGRTEYVNRLGVRVEYYHNESNRQTAVEYADGGTVAMEYDDAGNMVSRTDEQGHTRRFEYDERRNLIEAVDALGRAESWSYGRNGRMGAYRDKMGILTRYKYDSRGNLIAVVFPDSTTVSYIYDGLGRVTSVTDRRGYRSRFEYDENGYVSEAEDGEGNIEGFVHDEVGNLLSRTDATGATTETSTPSTRG